MEKMIIIQNEKEANNLLALNLVKLAGAALSGLILFFSFDGCKKNPENLAATHVETLFRDSLRYYNKDIAIDYFYKNKIDSAVLAAKNTIDFCNRQYPGNEEIENLKAISYNSLAIFYQTLGRNDDAIESLQKAAALIRQISDKTKLPDIYINLADNYYNQGELPLATDYYRKALWLSDSLNLMDKNEFSIYIGLGQIYANLKNYKVADFYYQKVENHLDSLDSYIHYQFANNRGSYYYQTAEYEQALACFKEANKTIKGYPAYEAVTEINMAEIFLLLNQPDSAKRYLDRAATVFLAPESSFSEKFYTNGLYASIALTKNNLKEAEQLLLGTYDEKKINPMYIYYNNKRLEELYAKKGDYKKAYEYKRKAEVYNDSIINNTTQNNIAEIEMRYQQDTTILKRNVIIAQREQKVAELQNMNTLIIAAGLIILLVIIAFLLYYRRQKDLQYVRQITIITNLRMENVRNRISPHFMFNILNAVLPALRQQENLAKPLRLLVQSIRHNLVISEKPAITLEEEIKVVANFIELRESIHSNKTAVIWDVDENVNRNIQVPSMCILIPVENALKYAFEEYDGKNQICIQAKKEEDSIEIVIEDNGIGFEAENRTAATNGTGNGLKILYKTIELLNAKNLRKITFTIRDKRADNHPDKTGTIVSITIPNNYNYKIQ
jgi:tetratricopeptide (TPR) repeat protein